MKTLLVTLLKTVFDTAYRVPRSLCLALLALVLAPSGWATTNETLTGSGNWTVPAGVTSVTVQLWGGGGGSGAKVLTGQAGRGAGGGGGGYSRAVLTVSENQTIAYSVGAGGSAGTVSPAANGGPGGDTTFVGVSTAGGGGGGGSKTTLNTAPTGGAGGSGGTANGGVGENGAITQANGAGGGAGGWTGSAGQNGGAGGSVTAGVGGIGGGTAPAKGGNGGTTSVNGTPGTTGGSPGGGASGGSAASAPTQPGSAGAAGTIILTYASAPTVTTPTATAITHNTATLGANATDDGGSVLNSRGTVWDTISSPTSNAAAEGGTSTGTFSHVRSGLTPGTLYYYRGYAGNAVGTNYSADGFFHTLATPATTGASNLTFSGVGNTAMTVNWTSGDGHRRIVIARAGSAPSGTPANATAYSASTTYSSGAGLAGGFVVYDGADNPSGSVTVSGLIAGTTYHFVVYEYTQAGSIVPTINYLTSSPLSGSQATAAATTPTITVQDGPVTLAFGSLGINSTSNKTYSVSGANLTADISITAPAGFEISTHNSTGFGSALTLTQSGGSVASTTIHVRFAPTGVQAYSGDVVNTSPGATTVNVGLTGTGVANPPTVTASGATGVTANAATLTGNITDAGGVAIDDRGFVYKTSPGVTISDNKVSGTAIFAQPGTHAWVAPFTGTIQVECWGGGGAGGWASKDNSGAGDVGCGGGAGGAYARLNAYSVTAGNTYYVAVGAGGVSLVTDGAAGPGGDSWFNSADAPSTAIIAKGGAGAVSKRTSVAGNTFGSGATGTVNGSAGDVVFAGGSGGNGSNRNGGSGGGSGGTGSAGINGTNGPASANTQVLGAPAVTGGGPGGHGSVGTGVGFAPSNPPGGGGGGSRVASTAQDLIGGNGADGRVVLTYGGSSPAALSYQLSGLSPNAQYFYKAYATNSAGLTLSSELSFYTLANVPPAPTVSGATTTTLNVRPNTSGNSATEVAIQEANSGSYVQANGSLGGSAVWQNTNTWGIVTVTNLNPGATYAFWAKARNGDNIETAFGPATTRATAPLAPILANNGPLCPGSTLTLTATTVSGATNYSWWGPNGFTNNTPTAADQTIPGATASNAGDYFVTAMREGQTSAAGTTTVTVHALPGAPTANNTTACHDGSAHSASATAGSGGDTVIYYTLPSGGSVTTAPSRSTPGTTTAYASTVSSSTGCESATRTAVVLTVTTSPITPAISGSALVQAGQAGVTYSVTLTSGSSYVWTVPPGASITSGASGPDNNQIAVIFGTTAGNVTAAEVSAAGCSGSPVVFVVDVNHAPVPEPLSFSVDPGDIYLIPVIGGKHPPTDADPGDTNLILTAVGAVSPGTAGTVSFSSNTMVFQASTNYSGIATFDYVVSDSRGGSGTNTVTAIVNAAAGGLNITGLTLQGGNVIITAQGIVGRSYRLQYTDTLNPVNWQDVPSTNTASAPSGRFTLTNSPATLPPSRFYRTRAASSP